MATHSSVLAWRIPGTGEPGGLPSVGSHRVRHDWSDLAAAAAASSSIHWPPDAKSLLIGKDHDARKDWVQVEKRETEDEVVGWHHWFNGHEFEQTLQDSEGQASLACCSPQGHKESDMTWQLNNNNKYFPKADTYNILNCLISDIFQYCKYIHLSNNSLFMVFSFSSEIILYTWVFKIRCV